MRRFRFHSNTGLSAFLGLLVAALTGCNESRTSVVQASDGLFAEGDSVVVSVRHSYVWWEQSDWISVGSAVEKGDARFFRHFPDGRRELLFERLALSGKFPSIAQLAGDTLVYAIGHSDQSSTAYGRDLISGSEFLGGGPFRISRGGKYFAYASGARDRATGLAVRELAPPKGSSLVLLDDAGPSLLLRTLEGHLNLWIPGNDSVTLLKQFNGSLGVFVADGDELLVFEETARVRGAPSTYALARVSDLLLGKKIFRDFTVDPGYRVLDVSLDEESVLAAKRFEFGRSDDTLRVFDFAGNLKRKIPVPAAE